MNSNELPPRTLSALEKARQKSKEEEEAHRAWKREFFISRPPPEPRDRLHRLNHHERRYQGVHDVFSTALALAKPVPTSSTVLSSASDPEEQDCNPPEQIQWLRKMREERERRQPFADPQISTDPTRTVLLANLPSDVTEEGVRQFADQFGRVTHVRVVRHRLTGCSRRYGFVEFGLAAEARKAVEYHQRKRLQGRRITIAMERGRVDSNFLPQRLAAAAALEASIASTKEIPANSGEVTIGLKRSREASSPVLSAESQSLKANMSAAPRSKMEDDEELLDAILAEIE